MKTDELKKLLLATFGHLADDQLGALTLFGEARGESREGKIAVGTVILERVDHRDWDGKTVKEVCLMPYQFSCFLPADPNFKVLRQIAENWQASIEHLGALIRCHDIFAGLMSGTIPRDPIVAANHCTQYLTVDCDAAWEKKMRRVATIGRHEFYA